MPWRIALLGVIAAAVAGSARADGSSWATTGFGVNGGVANVDAVGVIAAAPDGTTLAAGSNSNGSVTLFRYSADGRPIGFGHREKPRTLDTGTDCYPGLDVVRDGTILVACGNIVTALRPDGTLRSLTTIPGANFAAVGTDILGRMVAAGSVLVRLNADGSIDGSFPQVTLPSHANALLVAGGRILVLAGGSIVGYLDDGALDTSFGHDGVATFPGFTATSFGVYQHWILAGGSRGNQAAVVRYFAGGVLDTTYGTNGIVAWAPNGYMSAAVVGLGVRADGQVDTAVLGIWKADVYNSEEHPEAWFVQRVTGTGRLGKSEEGPPGYIDPTAECLQEFPVALAEQPNGMTLVSGIACQDAFDYTTYFLLERYDGSLDPDVGVPLRARVTATQMKRTAVVANVAVNGPSRLILRIQMLDGNDPIGAWLSPTRVDVAHGPVLVRLRMKRGELKPHIRYAVVVSAYDARGYFTRALAPLTP